MKIINNKLEENTNRHFSGADFLDHTLLNMKGLLKSRKCLVIIDSLLSVLSECQEGYKKTGFLRQLRLLTSEQIVTRSSDLIKSRPEVLEVRLAENFAQFTKLLRIDLISAIGTKEDIVKLHFYCFITENSLGCCFYASICRTTTAENVHFQNW